MVNTLKVKLFINHVVVDLLKDPHGPPLTTLNNSIIKRACNKYPSHADIFKVQCSVSIESVWWRCCLLKCTFWRLWCYIWRTTKYKEHLYDPVQFRNDPSRSGDVHGHREKPRIPMTLCLQWKWSWEDAAVWAQRTGSMFAPVALTQAAAALPWTRTTHTTRQADGVADK